jgi:aconitate hydratase
MAKNIVEKIISNHLISGEMKKGAEIGITIDQTLTQDATGTMVMLELEAMGLKKAKTRFSMQYVDHNQIQEDHKNPEDHIYLQTAAKNFGIYFSPPSNGISHAVAFEHSVIAGETILGSDSHTPAAGGLGALAIGAGGLEVALAIAGEPFFFRMPAVVKVEIIGQLPDWVSAKDVILELLRRKDVSGGVGKVFEYSGSGLKNLSAMDRHVICNMGAELGATTSLFPSDEVSKEYLIQVGREKDWRELKADPDAKYDEIEVIDLSTLEPLIALPSSPGNVRAVREVAGLPIYQAYIGSSANPGFRDFAIPAMMLENCKVHERVSFDVNPASRMGLYSLIEAGYMANLIRAGARLHQAGCNGCIGMGQAPATNKISLRTVPRNFKGRSGTKEDLVYLCSPETATASAIKGVITDPRTLTIPYPKIKEPRHFPLVSNIVDPLPEGVYGEIVKGGNIKPLPEFHPPRDHYHLAVILKTTHNISTDDISPAGAGVLPYRSNIPKISEFMYYRLDDTFFNRAMKIKEHGSIIVGGKNYGQGSSREHAAISTAYVGVKMVIAISFARIHRSNLANFGVIPFVFVNSNDYEKIHKGDELELIHVINAIKGDDPVMIKNKTRNEEYPIEHNLTEHEKSYILLGSRLNVVKQKL